MNRALKIDSRKKSGQRASSREAAPSQDWHALRHDLLDLLDEVEEHTREDIHEEEAPTRALRRPDFGYDGVGQEEAHSRHRAALNSVAETLHRFSHRDGEDISGAIEQIRDRRPAQDQRPERVRGFKNSVEEMSARLEDLGGELRSGHRSNTDVSEIADQINQLTQTVELLAGAVGESGQVRRLEAQIAQLAQSMEAGRAENTDDQPSEVNQRLERLAVTIEQMTDMHHQLADRPVSLIEELSGAQKSGFSNIEEGVRGVYDRLDAIENQPGIDPEEFERFSQEMGQLAEALQTGSSAPGVLLSRVDALNARMNQIERENFDAPSALGGLQSDLEGLRDVVRDAVEPRLSQMADQIDALGAKVEKSGGAAPLEDHVRQLIARMDQTGEQLAEISRLHASANESGLAPDFAALAELVAERTSKAVSKSAAGAPASDQRVHDGIKQVDARLARLEKLMNSGAAAKPASPKAAAGKPAAKAPAKAPEPKRIRIESPKSKAAAAEQATPDFITQPAPPAPAAKPAPKRAQIAPRQPAATPAAPQERVQPFAPPAAPQPAASVDDDMMQVNPSEDTPLLDRNFAPSQPGMQPDPGQQMGAPATATQPDADLTDADLPDTGLSDPNQAASALPQRERNPLLPPEQDMPQSPAQEFGGPQGFDPKSVEPPRKPVSSFAETPGARFADAPAQTPEDAPLSSHDTFIAAARRAARSHTQDAQPEKNSIVARLLEKLRPEQDDLLAQDHALEDDRGLDQDQALDRGLDRAHDVEEEAVDFGRKPAAPINEPQAEDSLARESIRQRLFNRPEPADEPIAEEAYQPAFEDEIEEEDENRSSVLAFASRHRRPLILAGMVLVVGLLAINLIERRMNAAPEAAPAATTSAPSPGSDVFMQPMLDPAPTGSVDPFVRHIMGAPNVGPTASAAEALSSSKAMAPTQGMTPSQTMPSLPTSEGFSPQMSSTDALQTASLPPQTGGLETTNNFAPKAASTDLVPEAIGPLELRQAAADGDARAQFEVAAIYSEGKAIAKDMDAAAKWYEKAAVQGFAPAEYRLGNLHEHGHGVAKDLNKAMIWYERAADHGNRMSMHNLAALYASGELGKQNFRKAAAWFERAAGFGLTDSQFNLGMLYARGLGVQQDMAISYKWFSLAAARGDDGAAMARDDVARSLGSDTVNRLKAEVAGWKPLSINMQANFAPIGTWAQTFDPGQTIDDKKVIEQVQAALQRLGFDVGTPDGVMGPRTREAISTFERSTGMSQSGAVNPRLLAVLGSQPV